MTALEIEPATSQLLHDARCMLATIIYEHLFVTNAMFYGPKYCRSNAERR